RYQHDPKNLNSLSHNEVLAIHEDKHGTIWLATLGGGLNRLQPARRQFKHYREQQGLANDVIYGMLADEQGRLWLSTNQGLSCFDPQTEQFKNYDVADGLQSNEFRSAYHKSATGELFFGGINGFNSFFPKQIQQNAFVPPIVLTEFQIFNKPVAIGKKSPLQQHISEAQQIQLSYQQSFFSFEFAALNYLQPEENLYAYFLAGLESEWNEVGHRRQAYYTNVPPGHYTFKVKGSNNDQVWNEAGYAIDVIIHPPFWQTYWAYGGYTLIFIGLLLSYSKRHRYQLRQKQHELEREQAIAIQLKQADKLKDQILANTSHELRTPLNGIIGIAESLLKGAAGPLTTPIQANLNVIAVSGRRLIHLINDILDFSQLRQHKIQLQLKPVNVHTLVETVLMLCQPLIADKNIHLLNAISTELPLPLADENRLQQILYNLIDNAIKFTEQGSVQISAEVRSTPPRLAISVTDSGIGISETQLEIIFKAFEQGEGSTTRNYGGSGLGLAITQQLVHLHQGEISVHSQVGQGSQITFTLPIAEQPLSHHPHIISVLDKTPEQMA
ncbi:MAG: ATP-binding protein, partial [Pseudomonadota bacterium]|nr:ATP-binding protein [Pseudomonadota bacterium]